MCISYLLLHKNYPPSVASLSISFSLVLDSVDQQFGLGSAEWLFFCSLLGSCMCLPSAGGLSGGWLV